MGIKKKIFLLCSFLAFYILILFLLVQVEAGAPDASIQSVWDAVWYSLATITTVGYGDMSPVTLVGRLLGLLFMLLSVGFFGFVISLFVSRFSRKIFPLIVLSMAKKGNCYIFDGVEDSALCLARNIAKKEKKALIVFCGMKDKKEGNEPGQHILFTELEVRSVIKRCKHIGKRYVFCMGDEGYVNYQKALAYAPLDVEIYCESPIYVDGAPSNLHIFNQYTSVARYLWHEYPLREDEKKIVILGCGQYGSSILEQALLVNVDGALGEREYHIFGDSSRFLGLHTQLSACFGIGTKEPEKDTLIFHTEDYSQAMEILTQADCIYMVSDSDEENLESYNHILRFVPGSFRAFVRECSGIDLSDGRSVFFGGNEDIMSYDIIIRDKQTSKAKEMHATYCKNNPSSSVPWEKLSVFTRRSNLSVADHIPTKLRILIGDMEKEITKERMDKAKKAYASTREEKADFYRRIEHERWMRFHILDNWEYAQETCKEKRQHNLLVPFDQLSLADQAKDDYGWEIL